MGTIQPGQINKTDFIGVKAICEKVGLEIMLEFSPNKMSVGREVLGFVPPKGTKITLKEMKIPAWNGIYIVNNIKEGNLTFTQGEDCSYGEPNSIGELNYIEDYVLELKKIQ